MNRNELLKLMVFLAVVTLMISVTGLTGRIAMSNGTSDLGVKWAMTVALAVTGVIGMACMIFLFIRVNKNVRRQESEGK
jgi:Na+/melibiose symporter-like transporter